MKQAPIDSVPRRMAAVPEPFTDESFGSWLARLADARFTTRAELTRALLMESGHGGADHHNADFNSQLPDGLIDALVKRTGRRCSDFEGMLVPTALAILPCGIIESGPYCPECWREDSAQGARHVRKLWCERWTVLCDAHVAPLRASRLSMERLLGPGAHNPMWLGETRISMWPAQLRAAILRAQRLIRAQALHCPISAEATDRVRVLSDLACLVGTKFETQPLIQQSLDLDSDRSCKLYWRDAQGEGLSFSERCKNRGTLEVRQLALRLAVVILSRMMDATIGARPEDIGVLGALNLLQPGSILTTACDRMVDKWPAQYAGVWELAFGIPGEGGAGYFARDYDRPPAYG